MKFKLLSKFIIFNILLNTIYPNNFSYAINNDRYETLNTNNITVSNLLEENSSDIQIKGESIANLLDTTNLPVRRDSYSSTEDTYAFLSHVKTKVPLIANQTYTIMAKYSIHSYSAIDSSAYNRVVVLPKLTYTDGSVTYFDKFDVLQQTGEFYEIIKLVPDKDVSLLELGMAVKNATASVSLDNAILLEGDYSKQNIDYFENIKSLGDDGYINIKTTGKNLFDFNMFKHTFVNNGTLEVLTNGVKVTTNGSTSSVVDGFIQTNIGSNKYNTRKDGQKFLIPAKELTDYTLSYKVLAETVHNHDAYIQFRDENYNSLGMFYIPSSSSNFNKLTVTAPIGTKYMHIRFDNNLGGNSLTFYDIQLEEGNIATEYEKYTENTLSIPINEPLRSITEEVQDKIIKKSGQWVIERNCNELILDGTEDWHINTGLCGTETMFFYVKTTDGSNNIKLNIVNDTFKSYHTNDRNHNALNNKEGMYLGDNTHSLIQIHINKSRLSTPDLNGFKQWLSENPLKVIYELEHPIYEPLKAKPTVNLFKGTTHILNTSNIQNNLSITIDRVLNKAREAIDIAKNNPTIQNISIARMWTNLANETLIKDEFQNKLNEITSIKGLDNIDKKSISANLDIYIKPQNGLSISLNTNNIIFDNYTSVEDIEKLNAVEVTVDSSLPYSLNASLQSRIESDDGSFIDSNALNIRESNGSYQAFSNVDDKIIINDNGTTGINTHNIDLKLSKDTSNKANIYRTTIKFEAVQK